MHSASLDMTSEPFGRNIIKFTIPIVLMSMLQILFMACDDMFILGLFVGSQALAAVGATTYIVNLFINGFAGLAVGVNVVAAQAIGAKSDEVVRKAVHTAISSSLILGVVVVIIGEAFGRLSNLGVAGVAIGTLLSQVFAAVLSVSYLLRTDDETRLVLRNLAIDIKIFKRILVIGVPTGLNNMAFSFSNMQIQSAINIFGSAAVAGCSVSTTMENFVYAATNSIMQAVISFTGQNVGAGKLFNVSKIVHLSLAFTFVIGTLLGTFVYLIGYPMLPFFIDSDAIGYAMSRNLVAMLPYGLCGVMEVYAGVQRGLGKGLAPTIITLLGVCIFRVIWVYTAFRAVMTIEMLFLSYPISWSATAIAHYVCYRRYLREMTERANMIK